MADKKKNPEKFERNPDLKRDTFSCIVGESVAEEAQERLHCKSKSFNRLVSEEVATALAEVLARYVAKNPDSPVGHATGGVMVDVFKRRVWDFAFVGVKKEHVDEFRKALAACDLNVTIKEATTREAPSAENAKEMKRDRFGYKIGHVPTLMELKSKLANWGRQKSKMTFTT